MELHTTSLPDSSTMPAGLEVPMSGASPVPVSPPLSSLALSSSSASGRASSSSSSSSVAAHTADSILEEDEDQLDQQPPPPQHILGRGASSQASPTGSSAQPGAVDHQLVEALSGKDRLYVLRIGEDMDALVNDPTHAPISFSPPTSFQRLLVYRCAQYLGLITSGDGPNGKTILVRGVIPSPGSPTPIGAPRRIIDIVPAAVPSSLPQAFKLMRRDPSTNNSSRPGSENGDLDEASGRAGGRKKKSYEERQAEYDEARLRIFRGPEPDESAPTEGRTRGGTATPDKRVDASLEVVPTAGEGSVRSRSRASSSSSTESVPVVFVNAPSASSLPPAPSTISSLPLRPSAPEFDPANPHAATTSTSSTPSSSNASGQMSERPSSSKNIYNPRQNQSRPPPGSASQTVRGPSSASSSTSSYQQQRGGPGPSYQNQHQQRSAYDHNSRSNQPQPHQGQQQQQQLGWPVGQGNGQTFQLPTQPFIPQPHQLAFLPSQNYNQPPQAYVFVPTSIPTFDTGQQPMFGGQQPYGNQYNGPSPQLQSQQPYFGGNSGGGPPHSYPSTPQQGPSGYYNGNGQQQHQQQQQGNWTGPSNGNGNYGGQQQNPQGGPQYGQQTYGRPDGTSSAPPFPHHSNGSFPPPSSASSSSSSSHPSYQHQQHPYPSSSSSNYSPSHSGHLQQTYSPQPQRFPPVPPTLMGGYSSGSVYTQHRSDSSVSSIGEGGNGGGSRPESRGSSSSGRLSFGGGSSVRQQGWNASGRNGGWSAGGAGTPGSGGSGDRGRANSRRRSDVDRASSPSSTTSSASRRASQLAHIPPPKDHPLPARPDWSVGNQQFDLRRPDPPSLSLTTTDFPPLAGDSHHSTIRHRTSSSSRPANPHGILHLGGGPPNPQPTSPSSSTVWQPGMGRTIVLRGVASAGRPPPAPPVSTQQAAPAVKVLLMSPSTPKTNPLPALPVSPPPAQPAVVEDDFEPRQPIAKSATTALFDPSAGVAGLTLGAAAVVGTGGGDAGKAPLSYSSVLRRT